MASNLLEKTILKKIDQFVEIVIDLSDAGENYYILRNNALKKAYELIPLLLHYLEGNFDHVEPLFYQLVYEKLPTPNIIISFGNIKDEINNILKESISSFKKDTKKLLIKEKKENLKHSIFKAFPKQNIILNYKIRGQAIDVFLPELKIALINEGKRSKFEKTNLMCKKLGIKLLSIPPEISKDYRRLLRFIKLRRNLTM